MATSDCLGKFEGHHQYKNDVEEFIVIVRLLHIANRKSNTDAKMYSSSSSSLAFFIFGVVILFCVPGNSFTLVILK